MNEFYQVDVDHRLSEKLKLVNNALSTCVFDLNSKGNYIIDTNNDISLDYYFKIKSDIKRSDQYFKLSPIPIHHPQLLGYPIELKFFTNNFHQT